MAPGHQIEEVATLTQRIADLEAQVERLRRTEDNQFRFMADCAPFPIWCSGTDAMRNFVNRAWLEFRGRAADLELGSGWTDGLHSDDRDLCIETYIKSFTSRQAFHMQYRLQRGDGTFTWVEDNGRPLYQAEGSFAGYLGTVTDITDRKRGIFTPDEESVRLVFALTERERQVLVLIAEGKSTKEAAARLGISYKTADSHRSRILEKLGVHETASMVRYAIRAGLIQP
jgi:PAS domain S-box-containing protein